MDSLKEIVLRIARPLEYATRSGTHGLSALKDLGRFVSQQAVTALGHSVHHPSVEADLLHLVHLFSDYETLGPDLRGRRIAEARSEEHTSELQSRFDLVCRLLLEKKKLAFAVLG